MRKSEARENGWPSRRASPTLPCNRSLRIKTWRDDLQSVQMTPAPENLVDIRGLDFAYGEQLVLKHINLPIQRGSTLGVIGPNGGGKTTLLRLLLARHTPTRGTIAIDGLS